METTTRYYVFHINRQKQRHSRCVTGKVLASTSFQYQVLLFLSSVQMGLELTGLMSLNSSALQHIFIKDEERDGCVLSRGDTGGHDSHLTFHTPVINWLYMVNVPSALP